MDKTRLLFEIYKDQFVPVWKYNKIKKEHKDVDISRLKRLIVNYQIERYGEGLTSDVRDTWQHQSKDSNVRARTQKSQRWARTRKGASSYDNEKYKRIESRNENSQRIQNKD